MSGRQEQGQQGNGSNVSYECVLIPKEVESIKTILKNTDGYLKDIQIANYTSSAVINDENGDHLYM